jgi:hypothetical protein|uniref:Uncharacterized protein n=1 Tax=viral metagenome TaxID=1070528 RepID=A0A6C0IMG2_9ZZZZ
MDIVEEFRKQIDNIDYKTVCNTIITTCGAYFLWVIAHYVSSHLYVNYCTPLTIMGVMASPFLIASPHCQALRWVIYEAGSKVNVMFALLAGWTMGKLKID